MKKIISIFVVGALTLTLMDGSLALFDFRPLYGRVPGPDGTQNRRPKRSQRPDGETQGLGNGRGRCVGNCDESILVTTNLNDSRSAQGIPTTTTVFELV